VLSEQEDPMSVTIPATGHGRRQLALWLLCAASLMIILDGTIVTVALPSIQRDLRFSAADLSWVMNAYLIAFGSLLLLAGWVRAAGLRGGQGGQHRHAQCRLAFATGTGLAVAAIIVTAAVLRRTTGSHRTGHRPPAPAATRHARFPTDKRPAAAERSEQITHP
jgi:MFS family permease